ncbi:MAG: FtsX-like permease family protein, partial [Proteobacteria bacterium]|nr:FtsX-like permease family protein [Pseudomonadota bacterium]
GIFNTIFMSVLERTREFGIMVALGYSPGQIFSLVMYESGFLAILGLTGVVLVSAWPYSYLSANGIDLTAQMAESGTSMDIGGVGMDTIMPVGMYPESGIALGILILLAVMTAGLYPAWKAGRVNPIESINLV